MIMIMTNGKIRYTTMIVMLTFACRVESFGNRYRTRMNRVVKRTRMKQKLDHRGNAKANSAELEEQGEQVVRQRTKLYALPNSPAWAKRFD